MRRLLGMTVPAAVLAATLAVAVGVLPGAFSPADAKPDRALALLHARRTRSTSPWYAGARRIIVPYGCPEPLLRPPIRAAATSTASTD